MNCESQKLGAKYEVKCNEPLLLESNRVMRFYNGGMGLDKWQNKPNPTDTLLSEDMCINTAKYIGPGEAFDEGYSQTIIDGEKIRLRSMIQSFPDKMLGKGYIEKTEGHAGILGRVGDGVGRLIIQYHPTNCFARKYMNIPFGKTETWYIIATRGEDGYCYSGLKDGVTEETFRKYFDARDNDAMLDCLHKVYFKKGELVHIPSSTLHAMGPGTTFLELHQPCDYTLRLERHFNGRDIADDDLHYGLGIDKLFEGIDFTTYTDEEIVKFAKPTPKVIEKTDNVLVEEILSKEVCPDYSMNKITVNGSYTFKKSDAIHAVMVMVTGNAKLKTNGVEKDFVQGRAAFIPASVTEMTIEGDGVEIVVGYPFDI